MRRIPPLNALRAFEAAARHLSFARAARELGVTATAISHQIRLLEDTIGHKLFRRLPRPMALTEAGERLFPSIRDALDGMAEAVDDIRAEDGRPVLRVSTTTAFASGVLLPKLGDWAERHPDLELEVHASDLPVNFATDAVDVAVRYARKPEASLVWQELCSDHYLPMLSPTLLAGETATQGRQAEVFDLPLITYRWTRSDPAEPSWEKWHLLAAEKGNELSFSRKLQGIRLSEESHAIEAALSGQGVVLASAVITHSHRRCNRLVPLSEIALPGLSYFLVHAAPLRSDRRISTFRRWLTPILQDALGS